MQELKRRTRGVEVSPAMLVFNETSRMTLKIRYNPRRECKSADRSDRRMLSSSSD